MSTKLTDAQLLVLSAAAQREDRCIVASLNVKVAAARKIAAKLAAEGLVEEIKAEPGAHVWRRDDATGEAYALKLTDSGLKAIAVEEAEAVEAAPEISPRLSDEGPSETKDHDGGAGSVAPPTAIAVPRTAVRGNSTHSRSSSGRVSFC